jgi:hypothetical protein
VKSKADPAEPDGLREKSGGKHQSRQAYDRSWNETNFEFGEQVHPDAEKIPDNRGLTPTIV